ncbi:hypothetical protein BLNAU_18070 [Blattamonas nauphoetae]|uniref:Uncharacterized protein n=1 Tax=Blattamonas nauphoetae TaxID=2049346 RepID=A0ABQ9X5E9_9EUKA|nr:hypothetical protein BLNAU_18070 [Blattamonas nauphoetae]
MILVRPDCSQRQGTEHPPFPSKETLLQLSPIDELTVDRRILLRRSGIHPSNVGFGGGLAGWMTEEALELRVCEQERGMDEGDGKREENDGSLFRPTSTTVELVELVELLVVVVGWDGMGQLCRSRRRQRTSNAAKWNGLCMAGCFLRWMLTLEEVGSSSVLCATRQRRSIFTGSSAPHDHLGWNARIQKPHDCWNWDGLNSYELIGGTGPLFSMSAPAKNRML